MSCYEVESEPRLQEEKAADEVHHALTAAGLPVDGVYRRLVITPLLYTRAPPALTPNGTGDQASKQLLEGDVVGSRCF